MTALAGLWHFGGGDTARDCRRMLKSQEMYGQESAFRSEGPVTLGRHLYRLLPEDRHDRGPVSGGEGRWTLVADIRIDNREELADAAGVPTSLRPALSDAGLLMRAVERWGAGAVERLVGDFAFVLWDAREECLILARDYLGQRPLHYHHSKDFFAVASMPKGLHALPDVPYEIDSDHAIGSLALLPESGSSTFYRGVHRVEPGHVLTVSRMGLSSRKYWRPVLEPLQLANSDDYDEALREHLDRAVGARLRGSDRGVASHLSGGLDSSAVAATAARLLRPSGRGLVAFTAVPRNGFDDSELRDSFADEGPLAAATAELHPNIEHVRICTSGTSPLDGLDRYFTLFDRPAGHLCNFVWGAAINEAARTRGLQILLTGQLGNLSFSHSGMDLLPQLFAQGRLWRLWREAGALNRNGVRAGTIAAQTIGPFLPRPVWRTIGRLRGANQDLSSYSAISPVAARRLDIAQRAAARGLDLNYRPRRSSVASRIWALGRSDLGNSVKGTLAGWGLDCRDPTADKRLVEFCLRVPLDQFMRRGVPRALARDALADRLPAAVLGEMRKGYQASDWHEGLTAARPQLREEIERIAACGAAAEALDVSRMNALAEDWPDGSWHRNAVVQEYRYALLRGVAAGHFIRKVSGTN